MFDPTIDPEIILSHPATIPDSLTFFKMLFLPPPIKLQVKLPITLFNIPPPINERLASIQLSNPPTIELLNVTPSPHIWLQIPPPIKDNWEQLILPLVPPTIEEAHAELQILFTVPPPINEIILPHTTLLYPPTKAAQSELPTLFALPPPASPESESNTVLKQPPIIVPPGEFVNPDAF